MREHLSRRTSQGRVPAGLVPGAGVLATGSDQITEEVFGTPMQGIAQSLEHHGKRLQAK